MQTISPAIDRAFDKGIHVIVFERKTNSPKFTAFISADNYEMGRVMGEYIASQLDGFGSFKIGIQCRGARPAKAFTVADNIEGLRVVFMPENTHDASGNRTKQFLQGCKVEELPSNKVDKGEESGD